MSYSALFIGRFQPFHLGHLSVLKQLDSDPKIEKIIIGIGSSQYSEMLDNPYSFDKRLVMIGNAIKTEITKPCEILAVPDIHDDKNWVRHVEKIVGNFDLVVSGNDHVRNLFEQKKYSTRRVKIEHDISGTKLRELIKNNDLSWQQFVPHYNWELI